MRKDRLYSLICEGTCNPNIETVDALLARDGQSPSAYTLLQQRALRYTLHLDRGLDVATCLTCQHDRRYGHTVSHVPLDRDVETV